MHYSCKVVWSIIILRIFMFGASAGTLDRCPDRPTETSVPSAPKREIQLNVFNEKLASIKPDSDTVLVGDSLIQFWPDALAARDLSTRKLLNYGVGLDRTQHVLWRLDAEGLTQLHPKKVILLVGTNNLKAGDDACGIYTGIKAVALRIKTLWPRSQLTVIAVPPRGPDFAFRDDDRRAINDQLAFDAAANRAWSVLNVDSEIACGFKHPCPNYLPDDVHLSEAGYGVLGALLKTTRSSPPAH